MTVDISLTIGRTRLVSPLILGSFDPMVDSAVLGRCFELCGDSLGAVVTKSTTLNPRAGYPEPRVARFGDGLLVASGNPNPGIAAMASEVRQFRRIAGDAVIFGSIVNDPDHPGEDLAEEFGLLAVAYAAAGVDGLELNLSCPHLDPNEREHTIVPAQDPNTVSRLVQEVKSALARAGHQDCLVIPKLTGWNCNPSEVARAAERAGADAVTLSNLFPGTGYYTGVATSGEAGTSPYRLGDCLLAHGKGGYSGKAMHSAVLLMIENLRKHITIPVIGTGGCAADLDSLLQTFMAGASAVETVTPFYFSDESEMDVLMGVNDLLGQFRNFLGNHGMEHPGELYQLRESAGHL